MCRHAPERPAPKTTSKPLATALRMLAARRLSEAQLRERLARREIDAESIDSVVAYCRREGFIDDALYARLYVETRRKAIGDRRLVAELMRRGIPQDIAHAGVDAAEAEEEDRLHAAIEKLFRQRPELGLPQAARSLERLGFPASSIYRALRVRAAASIDLFDVV
jgi:regulatory protein